MDTQQIKLSRDLKTLWTDYGQSECMVRRLALQRMPDKASTRRAFLNLSHHRDLPKKILDNLYTDTITYCMLPRQPTPTLHSPAKLNPSLSHSCGLFCAPKKVNSHQISNFQTLFAKHPGWRYIRFKLPVPAPGLKSRTSSHLQPLWPLFALFFKLPFFIFNSLQPLFRKHPAWGCLRYA